MTEGSGGRRLAIAGFGRVGKALAHAVADDAVPGMRLVAVAARDLERAREEASTLSPAPVVAPAAELPGLADVIVECAGAAAFAAVVEPALAAGRVVVALGAAGLVDRMDLVDLARETGGRLHIATGALPALETLRCAAAAGLRAVSLTMQLPPTDLADEPWLAQRGIPIERGPTGPDAARARLSAGPPVCVFNGTAREVLGALPRQAEMAAAVALAGAGLDDTHVTIAADPRAHGLVVQLEIAAETVTFTLVSREDPGDVEARDCHHAVASIVAALRGLDAPLVMGS